MPAAAQVAPALMTLIVARAVHLSLERGSAPVLAYYCACLAHVHVAMGDFPKAAALGKIADRLNRTAASPAIACAVHFILGAFVTFWSAGSERTLAHLRAGLAAALEAGDYLYACYCAMAEAVYTFQLGNPLEDVAQTARDAADLIDRTGDVTNHDVVQSLRLTIDRLVASSAPPTSDAEAEFERRVMGSRNPFVTSCHFLFQAVEKYLAGDDAGAGVCVLRSKPSVPGNFNGPQSMFFETLLLAHRIQSGAEPGPEAIAQLAAAEEQLRTWASASTEPFGHRHALIAAELAAATADDARALTMFEQATKLAREAGAPLFEALASEHAGRYAERRGWGQMARELYFRKASLAYHRWGHVRRARQLAARVAGSPERAGAFGVDDASWAAGIRTDNLDAIALAKATQALSGEIVLSKLMARLMDIAIAQAGAERGYLLLHRNGGMWLQCSAGAVSDEPMRLQSGTPLSQLSTLLPHTVVDFVMQARETVVLTPTEPSRFSADPYLTHQRPQSLLCMPMIRQGELIGILYLENRLASDVFGADQVELLEMLSTQAAISIENARLYEEMEERVRDRTRKLEESLRTIQEDQAKIIAAERRAAVAHLESEMAIAQRIQTSILPHDLSMPGMEISAVMQTATEVGGDYYDMVPTDDGGCWLGIGDVSGHGLNAGLVMLMIQSGLAPLMTSDSWVDPARLLCMVNRAIHENVRCRLKRDDYVTLSLFRFFADGRFLVAGAHEEIIVWRARTGQCEQIETRGTWIGMLEHIEKSTTSREGRLADGDVMVLFTDGIVEARGPGEEQFGLKRLLDLTAVAHAEPVGEICRRILEAVKAWSPERQDDQTIVALRRGSRR
jgi:serine phosphatase RsbU (regulator of sigma subunit)